MFETPGTGRGHQVDKDALLEGLTPSQRRAVTTETTPLCVLASAGAGKTRVLTRRIAYRIATGGADAGHVLALTFTRKAAGELGVRLRDLVPGERVAAGTFHAVAAAQLRRWYADRRQVQPGLLDRKARLLAPLAAGRPGLAGVPLATLASQVEWAQARMIDAEQFEEAAAATGRSLPAPPGELARLLARYRDEKRKRGLLDFDDLLDRCAAALETDASFAAAQRWQWRHVFVDEFQDVNPLQHRLLLAWLGTSRDLCVVGDPRQAVYGWNGADPRLLQELPTRWPGTEVVELDDNHRCSPQIVAAAAAVLGPTGSQLRSSQPDGAAVEVRCFASELAEARSVAHDALKARAEGLPWSHLAVLVRTNAQVPVIVGALRTAGIPCRAPGSAALLEHPVAVALIASLRDRGAAPLAVAISDLNSPPDADPDGDPLPEDAAEVAGALGELARQFQRLQPTATVGEWLAWLPYGLGADRDGPGADVVTVCSFHRAKGLEWPRVWVCGLERGLVPVGHASSAAEVEEERRLLYVALTRAAQRLRCSWASQRRFGERTVPREASPWLALIEGSAKGGGKPRPEQWPDDLRRARDKLSRRKAGGGVAAAAAEGADGAAVQALQEWRRATARASGVPAYVVLHDATLMALATRLPTTPEELLAVPGIGPVKAERYGAALLPLLSNTGLPPSAAVGYHEKK